MTRPSSKKINLQKRHKLNLGQYTYNEKDNQMGCITNQTRLEEKILRTARNTQSLKTLRWLLKRYKYGNAEVERELITLLVRCLYPNKHGPGVPLEPKPAQVDILRGALGIRLGTLATQQSIVHYFPPMESWI